MPASDPTQILIVHDKWATGQMLLACEKLSDVQYIRKFEIGSGSLQATLTHMIAAMNAWTDTLLQRPHRPRIDGTGIPYLPAELRQMHEESSREYFDVATSHPLDEIVKRIREGRECHFTRGAIITHVATHGMHHRAQCLNMLRQMGVKPLPLSSVMEWALHGDSST